MCNRIAYNGTATNHSINIYLNGLILLLITTFTWANSNTSTAINIYLKLAPTSKIQKYNTQFEQLLIYKKSLANYQLTPSSAKHPLHITLYLTQYPGKNKQLIIKRIKKLAKNYHPFSIAAQGLTTTPSRYVMLTVQPQKYLQQLSNAVVLAVNDLRDRAANIPAWAAHNPQKLKSFQTYGSPNVFADYTPHITFLAPHVTYSAQEEQSIYQHLQHLVNEFNQRYPALVKARVSAIGIGLADNQGQITKELASFLLY
ncbi:putative phosphonate metabolism protein [Legionella beliardensis]|uniref:Putative phosphonate metabolism protein n=1 Tax=Legionella beliardensis TaxID=91822 RepID=A0A378I4J3_9GAMM|nr:2'-5' RNA ligase family protein [Legionella beliardensis]STX30108.1 putative phosphonate metabolism protein [Legionella beliardensis]